MRPDFSPALIALLVFSIVAAKIGLYTSSRFVGYSPPFLKNLLVKGQDCGRLDRNMLYAGGAFKLANVLVNRQAIVYTHS